MDSQSAAIIIEDESFFEVKMRNLNLFSKNVMGIILFFFLLPKHLIGKLRNIIVGFMKISISCSPTEMIRNI